VKEGAAGVRMVSRVCDEFAINNDIWRGPNSSQCGSSLVVALSAETVSRCSVMYVKTLVLTEATSFHFCKYIDRRVGARSLGA
jgi:hypothetical protein